MTHRGESKPLATRLREMAWGSSEYEDFCRLRQRYLRAPLGLDLRDEDLDAERSHRHFGLYHDDELIGGAVLVAGSDERAQLRQMLVVPEYRRRGLGRRIVRLIEATARESSTRLLFLEARLESVDFYRHCGYRAVGDEFIHVTIPHVRMEKPL